MQVAAISSGGRRALARLDGGRENNVFLQTGLPELGAFIRRGGGGRRRAAVAAAQQWPAWKRSGTGSAWPGASAGPVAAVEEPVRARPGKCTGLGGLGESSHASASGGLARFGSGAGGGQAAGADERRRAAMDMSEHLAGAAAGGGGAQGSSPAGAQQRASAAADALGGGRRATTRRSPRRGAPAAHRRARGQATPRLHAQAGGEATHTYGAGRRRAAGTRSGVGRSDGAAAAAAASTHLYVTRFNGRVRRRRARAFPRSPLFGPVCPGTPYGARLLLIPDAWAHRQGWAIACDDTSDRHERARIHLAIVRSKCSILPSSDGSACTGGHEKALQGILPGPCKVAKGVKNK